ncbi:hypothetical protein WN48_08332 [Eufriesea mexicana]|uniref:Uncharacterized protein n=1 Tax=Eufriesea mexicana TaxID=516756 RepID=A0A310SAR4_9HYME|nr:hypothetical protein WN48_08332 [Eufriesea mexicana]
MRRKFLIRSVLFDDPDAGARSLERFRETRAIVVDCNAPMEKFQIFRSRRKADHVFNGSLHVNPININERAALCIP